MTRLSPLSSNTEIGTFIRECSKLPGGDSHTDRLPVRDKKGIWDAPTVFLPYRQGIYGASSAEFLLHSKGLVCISSVAFMHR